MKWFLVAAGVFLGALVLFFASPNHILIQVREGMEKSLANFNSELRPVVNRAAERIEPGLDGLRNRIESAVSDRLSGRGEESTADIVRGRVESRRSETFQADLSGIARVLDGDTIEIANQRIRLWGVDAPEGKQTCLDGSRRWPCGRRATQALAGRIDGRSVACEERDRDGRIIAVCRHGGRDVNAWLVREGWALAYRRYSRAYIDEESVAKGARRGLWRGEFVRPWDWRRGERLQTASRDTRRASSRDRGACNIKGNISRNSGRRIFHVPGDRDYADTRISTSHGERWFCTESEARAAGWRRAPGRSVSTVDSMRRLKTSNRDARRASTRDRGACNIKGNISRNSGKRIYHVPGDSDYADTRIGTSHGERWFCTESEARAAGWRRAGR